MMLKRKKEALKTDREPYLTKIEVHAQPKNYTIDFFSDLRIANTEENLERWQHFIDTLSPKQRIGEDPDGSGEIGILYRDNTWLGDLVLADDVKSFNVIEDITRVKGDLVARMALRKNKDFTHHIHVEGDLVVHVALLRQTPPELVVDGGLGLVGVRSVPQFRAPPALLHRWGVTEGKTIRMAKKAFTLASELDRGGKVIVLRAQDSGASYFWEGNQWVPIQKSEIGARTLQAVFSKLTRICKYLGLGQDFLILNKRKIGWGIRKLCLYLTLVQGELAAGFEPKKAQATGELIDILLNALKDLESNIYADNTDDPNIMIVLDTITDTLLEQLHGAIAGQTTRAEDVQIKNDIAYCTRLLEPSLTVNELMTSTCRTVLFLTMVLTTPAAKRAALAPLQELRDLFRALVSGLGVERRVKLGRLLKSPRRTLDYLADVAVTDEHAQLLRQLEEQLVSAEASEPRVLVKAIFNSPMLAAADAPEDKLLVSKLFSTKGALGDFPVSGRTLVELLLINFDSFRVRQMEQVRARLMGDGKSSDVGIRIITENLHSQTPAGFVQYYRDRLEWDLSVFKGYNASSVTARRSQPGAV